MIVDSSAIIAILSDEPEGETCLARLAEDPVRRISAATYLETGIVADRAQDPVLGRRLDDLLRVLDVAIESVTEAQARIARHAYRDFGKGSGHPAQLNFGDCFAYALARETGEPLLFVGNDFIHTDLQPVVRW